MSRKEQVVRIYRERRGHYAPTPERQKESEEKLLHLRRRALVDLVPLAGAVFLTHALLPSMSNLSLIAVLGIFLAGIALYLVRRNADFARLAEQQRRLAERTEGLGVSLADWQQGATLAPWAQRVAKKYGSPPDSAPWPPAAPIPATNDSTRTVDHESL